MKSANTKTKKRAIWLSVGILAILLGGYLTVVSTAAQTQDQEGSVTDTVQVKAQKLIRESVSFPFKTSGMIASKEESNLSFKTGGLVKKIYVREGDEVRKNQLLAQLNLDEIEAQAEQAKISYEKAKRDLERSRKLYADTVGTLENLQNAESAYNLAKAELKVARFNLRHSSIYAPSKGHILYKHASENELVAAGQPVVSFASNMQEWIVKVGVSDKQLVNISLGDSAHLYLDAYPNEQVLATISQIGNAPDPASGLYEVELTLQSNDLKLRNGFFTKVEIYPSWEEKLFMIPTKALVRANGKEGKMYVVSANLTKPLLQTVGIQKIREHDLAINEGLTEGEYVLTEGYTELHENSIVSFQK